MDNSESLANVVFTRTAKGVVACKANNKDLPRQLKSLLLVVDGESPVSKFIPYLTNLLPLSDKFSELEFAGYIQRNPVKFNSPSSQSQPNDAFSGQVNLQSQQNAATVKEQIVIAKVLHEIKNFLASNAGLEALPIMSILTELTTVQQLKAELLAYFDLIESYDIDAALHALQLEKIMLEK